MAFGNKRVWTDAGVSTLRDMWLANSASAIAKAIGGGVTRNGVIGKANRLRLQRKSNDKHDITIPRTKRPPAQQRVRKRVAIPRTPPAPLSTVLAVANANQCQWPIGDPRQPDFAFCGEPKATGSYCEFHRRASCKHVLA